MDHRPHSLLSFVDASGLSALIVVARHARNVGLEFGIAATGESLQRLLDLCSVREF